MINKYTNNKITWIDVENPSLEEVRTLMEEYDINPDVARELQFPTYKEKITVFKEYLYIILHFPVLRHSHNESSMDQEVDFIVGQNFIITTRYETVDPFEKFSKTFELNNILNRGLMEDNASYVLYYMLKELYRGTSDEIDSINDRLDQIERSIFKGKEKEMVSEISVISRDLISFNHIILTHKDVLTSLNNSGVKLFDNNFEENFTKILNEYHRIEKTLMNSIDFLRELRSTNNSLLSTKQNETMKILTVITFVSLPISVINGFFYTNALHTPIIGHEFDWEIIVTIECISALIFFLFSKFKKWI